MDIRLDESSSAHSELPLVIDLDGTLLRSDILIESGLQFFRDRPREIRHALSWIRSGKAGLKHELAGAVALDVSVLPYNQSLLTFIKAEHGRGRRLVLATASNERPAKDVAQHLSLFHQVIGSTRERNLSGTVKRDVLVNEFGRGGYDYAGNSQSDFAVWGAARNAYVVNGSAGVERRARKLSNFTGVINEERQDLKAWLQAARVHQWTKNLLLFLPLLAAHRFRDFGLLANALVAFLCFGLCASSVYITNDLLDLKDDRHHPVKRLRPFASGRLSIPSGLVGSMLCLLTAFWLAYWRLPVAFLIGIGCYYVLTLSYSLAIKRIMVVDVVTLAGLYTLRIIAGGLAVSVPISFWLLALSMFAFLSLAIAKRYAEIHNLAQRSADRQVRGRDYSVLDLPVLSALGTAAGYMAVLVLALYINDSRTAELYRYPMVIWLVCPILLTWISRVWILTARGQMNEDPVLFALRDQTSLVMGSLMALVFLVAS